MIQPLYSRRYSAPIPRNADVCPQADQSQEINGCQRKNDFHGEQEHGPKSSRKVFMKRVLLAHILWPLLAGAAYAQVAPMPFVRPQFLDNNGSPLAGGRLYSYQAGTSNQLQTYCDALGSTPNQNPVVLDAAGRPVSGSNCGIFLGGNAYKLVLQNSVGALIWTIDNVTASNIGLLSSNNTWTGTNTFNNTFTVNSNASFNAGITSTGPNTLTGGGTLSGTYAGSAVFSGTPNFAGGFLATTGTFSSFITSNVATGNPPFFIASSTQVANLNASFLAGCTWAAPCPIGSTTPSSGVFATLTVNTGLVLAGSTGLTNVQGTDFSILTAGTVSGTGKSLCTDANGGATTTGCPIVPPIVRGFTYCASGCDVSGTPCTTSGSSNNSCTNTFTIPVAFADSKFAVSCSGIGPSGVPNIRGLSKSASTITITTANGTNDGALASSYSEFDCIATHN
jgi:hypothetical protein